MFRMIQSWLKPATSKPRRDPRLTVTALEAREVPAVLNVTLTAPSAVQVRPMGDNVDVAVNGVLRYRVPASAVDNINVTGSNGNDSVTVTDRRVKVTFDGWGGEDTLTMDRSALAIDTKYVLAAEQTPSTWGTFTATTAHGVSEARFNRVENLRLCCGNGDDTVDATGVPGTSRWSVDGGGQGTAGDTFTGSNKVNRFFLLGRQTWWDGTEVTGPNHGLHNQSAYKGFENLLGNTHAEGSDEFIVTAGGSLTGWINGAGGLPDVLSYSQDNPALSYGGYASGVTVDLQLNRATAIGQVYGIENVIGSAFADVIYGNLAANHLDGRGGNDCIYGGLNNDTLVGGAGHDLLDDNDPLYGGGGHDVLNGGEGNDTLYGRDGNDVMYGEAGDDRLYGGSGYDWAFGGAGNDDLDLDNEYRDWS